MQQHTRRSPAPTGLPHPIPYQGSKRHLASQILALLAGRRFQRFYEPFAGSAALTIAAAQARIADEYILGDSLHALIGIWQQILTTPQNLAQAYEQLWAGQLPGDNLYYNRVRSAFNSSQDPAALLYLLARCVKNSLRFNQQGEFNQSHDRRRAGTQPHRMQREILQAWELLASHTRAVCDDFMSTISQATARDVIYMDPPYQGTTLGRDKRYHQGLERERLIAALAELNRRRVPFIVSYDGRCGETLYGKDLPAALHLTRLELQAGRSSQATLSGRSAVTVESLYLSNTLV